MITAGIHPLHSGVPKSSIACSHGVKVVTGASGELVHAHKLDASDILAIENAGLRKCLAFAGLALAVERIGTSQR